MANYAIIVGSVLGASEYVADALKEVLEQRGHQATIALQPDLTELSEQDTWIICTSTHGAGDLPDNIQPFAQQLKQAQLPGTRYLIVGLGDSSYDTFCFGAEQIQTLMNNAQASLLTKPIHIDVLTHPIPEDTAVEWLQHWLDS